MAENSPLKFIKKTSEYSKINLRGQRVKLCPWIMLIILPSEDGLNHFGITVSRKVGSAVIRNKLKRWVRHSVRSQSWPKKFKSKQIVFVFRAQPENFYKKLEFKKFKDVLRSQFFDE